MITDIFANRYEQVLFAECGEKQRAFFHQVSIVLFGELIRKLAYNEDEIVTPTYGALCKELGYDDICDIYINPFGNVPSKTTYCVTYLKQVGGNPDKYIKVAFSLIELMLRATEFHVKRHSHRWPDGQAAKLLLSKIDEINERLRMAGFKYRYNNGIIQRADDEFIENEVARPFWDLIADARWQNVEADIKQSIDERDNNGPDPALYAARALESTIKIISDEKGWTRKTEKGAANFIDNLVSVKNGRFIDVWESEELKGFFAKVRNPSTHGAGAEPLAKLTELQASRAIEYTLIWIKSLIRRL